MRHFIGPYFHSAIKVKQAEDKEGIRETQKAVVDLETLLTHLQQDTDIPQVELFVDPDITKIVAQVWQNSTPHLGEESASCLSYPPFSY